ncbi:GPI inositol-deacylase-like [Pyrus ussuriensis x Pyrus communis]|uniref:GPI inositol-deacylase n=1 Tax=Pyrus ussuriensis x Pyrus communis TaxID=2448454 RepID=A0A5N5GLA1_9ROSA|nr:GPI inositol-deacylase-like [Pyrus ussuriensis x Pyrus communis]
MQLQGFKAQSRVALLVAFLLCVCFAGLYDLLKPVSNGCIMTYMYPTYVPIPTTTPVSPAKYSLYLYHEGWKKIDFEEHLKKLSGVPVLFIPGNGGSYKQVRSLAAESDRGYQAGPLERTYYQDAYLTPEEGGEDIDVTSFKLPKQYDSRLDWFTVDLEGEHSAMDSAILEEHAEYVVNSIHRILDQYKESYKARQREGAATSGSSPKSVILVGHSMGGFVARAAVIHHRLRKSAVETIVTLSSPHQYPPVALQPSLGHYFERVNDEWRKGYEVQTTRAGHHMSGPVLSHVVVISISGGYNDYQVRSKSESLDGIVPPTHGFVISSTGMRNVWLSMEHQAILWCNQLVIQLAHTLLSLVDSGTGQPFSDTRIRTAIFSKMLRSGIPQSFDWRMQSHLSQQSIHIPTRDVKDKTESLYTSTACPSNVHWSDDGLERDLYIQTTTVTVLAMDGRRRWLDIQKLGSNGRSHFMFVTNLAPCSGVRLHLWPEKRNSTSELPICIRILDVTSRMVRIPSGPAPTQPTEQASPSAIFRLGPEDMRGFRFLTISVAPRPTISGRPPPAVSMAVGQFFNPEEGEREFSPWSMPIPSYSYKLGLLPVMFSLKAAGCGIKNSGLPDEQAGDEDNSKLCKLRCFPPIAFAWDHTSGLHIFPNMYSEKIVVDSSPALWSSPQSSEKTSVMLLVDPHCSYRSSMTVPVTAVASRFLLLYNSQIAGFSLVVIFFALMQQICTWDLDQHIPSILTAVEFNLRIPLPFLYLAIAPILLSFSLSFFISQPFPSFSSFTIISVTCYLLANGFVIILILISQLIFYAAAVVHVFIKTRFQLGEKSVHRFINLSSGFFSLKVVRVLRANPVFVTALVAITLACLVHAAFGLFIILFFDALSCHSALCSFLTASFRSHARRHELFDCKKEDNDRSNIHSEDCCSNSPNSSKSFGETQLELFHHRHGLFILHLAAALMFVPSLVAWFQRIGMGHSFPWLLDSFLCTGVILHGIFTAKPESSSFLVSFPGFRNCEVRLNFLYLLAGYYSYISSLALAPYRAFYGMAAIGFTCCALTILQNRNREKGEPHFVSRKHSHRH